MKAKELLPILANKKFIKFKTSNGEWIMFKQSDFPFYFRTKFGNVELIHRHSSFTNYRFTYESEWVTPSGIRKLINYIKKRDFDTEFPETIDDSELNIEFVSFEDIIVDLPYSNILEDILKEHNEDMEFFDIDLPENMNSDDEEDFVEKKIEEQINIKKEEYLDIFNKYSKYLPKDILKLIHTKINELS